MIAFHELTNKVFEGWAIPTEETDKIIRDYLEEVVKKADERILNSPLDEEILRKLLGLTTPPSPEETLGQKLVKAHKKFQADLESILEKHGKL